MITKKKITNLIVELILIVVGLYGLYLNFFSHGFMGNGSTILYFTIQSNIAIIAITIVFFILKLVQTKTKKRLINNTLLHIKYVFTLGITITFLVFFILLAPTSEPSYLSSLTNLTVHCFVPILAVLDFFLFDNDIRFNQVSPLIGTLFPLAYLGFVFICIASNIRFNGDLVPYFFLNYETHGWFDITENRIGVFYYIIILLALIILLGYLFALVSSFIHKKSNKLAYIEI